MELFGIMRKDIHPNYHKIKVVMTDGTDFFVRSTYGEEGAVLNLDVDSKSHPAWTGGQGRVMSSGGRVSRFKNRFGDIFSTT